MPLVALPEHGLGVAAPARARDWNEQRHVHMQTGVAATCMILCYRLAGLACYNTSNCETLEESLVELQTLLLHNEHLLSTPGLLPKLYDAIAVTSELFAAFSGR